jgi:hypothetical protein
MRPLFISTLLILLLGSNALAGAPNTVAIAVDATIPGGKKVAELQNAVASRVLAGFESFKLKLTAISDPKILAQVRDCKDATCLQEIAKTAELGLVVHLGMKAKKPAKGKKTHQDSDFDYAISLLVARDVPDRKHWQEKTECSDCSTAEAKQAVFLLSATLGERISAEASPSKDEPVSLLTPSKGEPDPLPPPSEAEPEPPPEFTSEPDPLTPPPAIVAPPARSPGAIVAPPPPEPKIETKPEWYKSKKVAIAAMAGGVVLMGTGIYLLKLDGEGTCDLVAPTQRCPDRYKTANLGAGFLIGGGLAAMAGLASYYFFSFRTHATQTTVGFTGSSISVQGTF